MVTTTAVTIPAEYRVNDGAVGVALGTLSSHTHPLRGFAWRVFGQRLFNMSFHNWYWLRGRMLRAFGARVHPTARLRPSAQVIEPWNLTIGAHTAVGDAAILECHAPVRIGDRCTVSQYTRLCTAMVDEREPTQPPVIAPITVEDDAWVAADVMIWPGVVIGTDCVVGSRSTVRSSLPPRMICAGDPARALAPRETTSPQSPPSDTSLRETLP